MVQTSGVNDKLVCGFSFVFGRGVTVPDFLVRDSANAKPSRFRDTENEFQHFSNRIDLQTGSDFP